MKPRNENIKAMVSFYREATEWVCECGKRCDPLDSNWRFNGKDWEHCHSYPMGHVVTKRQPPEDVQP